MTSRIDSHQHFWRPARGDYGWLRADQPGLAPLVRDFLPADLAPTIAAHGVGQTVLVQAAPSEDETAFLLDLAAAHDWIGGVVGWVDLADAGAVRSIERFARQPKFKGVRPMLQDLAEHDWIARRPDARAVQALVANGLRFDALVRPAQLSALRKFAEAWPALPMVIDHAAKPPVGAADSPAFEAWRQDIAALAALPQVHCKLSALWGEAPATTWHDPAAALAAIRPVWAHVLAQFGPDRLMWGSDWPVLTLAGDYAGWVAICEALLEALPPAERARVWRGTAQRFYGLADG